LRKKSREKDLEGLVMRMLCVLNRFDLRHVKEIRFENQKEKGEIELISGKDIFGLTVYDTSKPRIYLKNTKDRKYKKTILIHEILHGAFQNATEDYCYDESKRLYDVIYKRRRKNE
jgi:hypothetical protein